MMGFGSGQLLLSCLKYNPDRTYTKNQLKNLGGIQEDYLLIPFQRENFRKEIQTINLKVMVLIFVYFPVEPVVIFCNCKTKYPGFPKQYFFILSTRTNQRFLEALFCCSATASFLSSDHTVDCIDFLICTLVFLAQCIKFHGSSHNSSMR